MGCDTVLEMDQVYDKKTVVLHCFAGPLSVMGPYSWTLEYQGPVEHG